MKFRVIYQNSDRTHTVPIKSSRGATDRGVAWINRFLDRECVRRLAKPPCIATRQPVALRALVGDLHHTDTIAGKPSLIRPCSTTCGSSPASDPPFSRHYQRSRRCADRAIRNKFPDAPSQAAPGF